MPTIKVVAEKKEVEVEEGTNLRLAALAAGVNLYQGVLGMGASVNKIVNCRGLGTCGTCSVYIKKGMDHCSEPTSIEKLRMRIPDRIDEKNQLRLACQTQVNGDIEVETGPEYNLFGENFFS
ncbi:MAG: (2Fe-2S)-binding protein [bacterium]|nr:(2Fe-2S)-binding protein [bacterium]